MPIPLQVNASFFVDNIQKTWSLWYKAVTHLVPKAYGHWTFGPKQWVPNQFSPHGQMVPMILVHMDKWSQTNLVPLDKWSLNILFVQGDRLSGNTRTKLDGDHLSRGTKFFGTICPWDRICWGPFVQGDQFYGDCLSRGTGSWGPEVRGPNGFETKWVAADIIQFKSNL